jgi:SprT protein
MTELQAKAINRIHDAFQTASKFYSKDFNLPTISFKLKGRRAGYASFYRNKVALNNEMLHANGDAFISDTPGHEAAHLIAYHVYGTSIRPHGIEWKKVMRVIGQEPNRCHSFEVVTRYRYFCKCSDRIFLTTQKHNRMQTRKTVFYCKNCKETIRWSKLYDKSIYSVKSDQDNPQTVPSLYR